MIKLSQQVERMRFDLSAPEIYRMEWAVFDHGDTKRIQFEVSGFDHFSKEDLDLEFHLSLRLASGNARHLKTFRAPLKRIRDKRNHLGAWFSLDNSFLEFQNLVDDEQLEVDFVRITDRVGNAALFSLDGAGSNYLTAEAPVGIFEISEIPSWSWHLSDIPALVWPRPTDTEEHIEIRP